MPACKVKRVKRDSIIFRIRHGRDAARLKYMALDPEERERAISAACTRALLNYARARIYAGMLNAFK